MNNFTNAVLGGFQNFEAVGSRIPIYPHWEWNLGIFLFLAIVTILSLKKNRTEFLDLQQTDQLRGLSIFLVVWSHFWIHVTKNPPPLVFGQEGVEIFLMISAVGLTLSQSRKQDSLSEFFMKRLKRVFFPYWIATALFLILNGFLLRQILSLKDFALTVLGINVDIATKHIDYVRWFITLLIAWYLVFAFSRNLSPVKRFWVMLTMASLFFLGSRYALKTSWYGIFAFPVGYALGVNLPTIRKFLLGLNNKGFLLVSIGSLSGIFLDLFYKQVVGFVLERHLPSIVYSGINEGVRIIFALSVVLLFGQMGSFSLVSRFLVFMGGLSYEIYLLHGPFLIKYNFFHFQNIHPFFLLIYLAWIIGVSMGLKVVGNFLLRAVDARKVN